MMKIVQYLIVAITIHLLTSCANQQPPEGGPKDTIPPTLLKAFPAHLSTNVNTRSFEYLFDERINTDKLKKELIIIPGTENKYKINFKKTSFTLTFEEALDSSTTYTFNFASGVVDVTEKNPVDDFKYVFSTGENLDSLYITGRVTNSNTGKPEEQALVMLQRIQDSTDLFSDKPYYFDYTDEDGIFEIENIKNNSYHLYAYKDLDKNLLNKPQTEPLAFSDSILHLTNNRDSLLLSLIYQDHRKLKFLRDNTQGKYYLINYNRPIKDYQVSSTQDYLPSHHLTNNNSTVRFYYNETYTDSLAIVVTAQDSTGNTTTDSLQIRFDPNSKRKALPFSYTVMEGKSQVKQDSIHLELQFSKPVQLTNHDSILFVFDSLFTESISASTINFDSSRINASLNLKIPYDTINYLIAQQYLEYKEDSINASIDSTLLEPYKYPKTDHFHINFKKAAFISIEGDTSQVIIKETEHTDNQKVGNISGSINTDKPHYILQLLDNKYQKIRELRNEKIFQFSNVPPGEYIMRIIIDHNNDGLWNKGNIHLNIPPEETIIIEKQTSLRANWDINDVDIAF